MSYEPVVIDEFGGLNLRDEPSSIGLSGAQDLLNVDLDAPGRVRTRDGVTDASTSGVTITGTWGALARVSSTYMLGISVNAGSFVPNSISSAGVVNNFAAGDTYTHGPTLTLLGDEATGGTGEVTYAFLPRGDSGNMHFYTISAGVPTAAGSVVGRPRFAAAMASEGRLAQGGYATATTSPSGADGSPSTVFFSDAGAPATYPANNFVHLRPGDGEEIRAMVAWRELMLVFKESVVFVFYGTSTNEAGDPVFNYRSIDLPDTLDGNSRVTAGDDGVYFTTSRGVYRTGGDIPQPVGLALHSPTAAWPTFVDLKFANGRLYASTSTGVYVLDAEVGVWLYFELLAGQRAGAFTEWNAKTYFGSGTEVYSFTLGATTDAGTAIASRYASGYSDLGTPDPKVVREEQISGTGTVTFTPVADGTDATTTSLVLGAAPGSTKYARVATRGRTSGYKLSATSGAWNVTRVTLHPRDARAAA